MTRFIRNSFKIEDARKPSGYCLRDWLALAVGGLLLCGSASIYGHQGVDHSSMDENGSPRSHVDDATGHILKTKIPAQSSSSRTRWGASFFPNVELVTHEGKTVRFFDDLIKDKVVMINFMYASCADSCSLVTAQLAKVQQLLGDRVGKDVFMYSITIDPKKDTPEVLSAHVKKFGVKPGWIFLTGAEEDVMLLRIKLGFRFQGIGDDIKDHNTAVLMGNQPTGQWLKRSPMDSAYFLAEQFGSWLSNWKVPSRLSNNNYSEAPELQVPTMGENLFRTRCAACHTIGEAMRLVGKGENTEKPRPGLGPDLLGVTRKRDRAWLARWLANPAKMLAENDPIATRLYADYGKVLMPNFHLGKVEVDALIEHMEAETNRLENTGVKVSAGSGQ